MSQIKAAIKFWGIRGSIASGSSKFGSHTSCVELDLGNGHSIFFDAGTGIRVATLREREFKKITLCLSHFHWDHIQGLPFMGPLVKNHIPIEIISGFSDTEERLNLLFDTRFHPVELKTYQDKIKFKTLATGSEILIEGLKLSLAPLTHPGDSYAFRVASAQSSFCYATDSDYDPVPDPAKELLHNADWAIMDSQFLVGDSLAKAEYGHASFRQAIDVAAAANIKNCVLFHLDPNYSDQDLEKLQRQALDYVESRYSDQGLRVVMAKEGLSIPIIF